MAHSVKPEVSLKGVLMGSRVFMWLSSTLVQFVQMEALLLEMDHLGASSASVRTFTTNVMSLG